MTLEQIGLVLQIFGVSVVFLSQVRFWYKAWRKCGGLKKTFFAMISTVRVGARDCEKLKEDTKEYLKKTFPEWWTLAEYLAEDIRDSAIGLFVTLIGLFIELVVTLFV